jgi:D-tyrosyl-tRNA(Tyr) deacylase
MIALLQRVKHAQVDIANQTVARIGSGLLVLAAVQQGDTPQRIERMAERLLGYRLFADAEGKMNRSVQDVDGEVLLVSQFTLAADTDSGMRPSFTPAAAPEAGLAGFDALVAAVRARHGRVQTGRFGADMQVSLCNDGPVTFWLET